MIKWGREGLMCRDQGFYYNAKIGCEVSCVVVETSCSGDEFGDTVACASYVAAYYHHQ